jgi:hypothetical protein
MLVREISTTIIAAKEEESAKRRVPYARVGRGIPSRFQYNRGIRNRALHTACSL